MPFAAEMERRRWRCGLGPSRQRLFAPGSCTFEQFAKLRLDPGLAGAAFEEPCAMRPRRRISSRTATRPVEIDGIELGKGKKVLMFLGAANRDPRRWERADEHDISRRVISDAEFGTGIHQCVGSLVARLEDECMLTSSIGVMQDIKERYAHGRD